MKEKGEKMSLEVLQINRNYGLLAVYNDLYLPPNRKFKPKIAMQGVFKRADNSGGYDTLWAYLDVAEVVNLIRKTRMVKNGVILESFKGGEEKDGNVYSRILRVDRDAEKGKVNYAFSKGPGETNYVMNKHGQRVPGVVKPKGKATLYGKMPLSNEEAIYIAEMLDKELTAWRILTASDYKRNPAAYDSRNRQPT